MPQEYVSRFSSVTSMLTSLNLPTLQERRNRAKLQMLYHQHKGVLYLKHVKVNH